MTNTLFGIELNIYKDEKNEEFTSLIISFRDDIFEGSNREDVVNMVSKYLTPDKINSVLDFAVEEVGRGESKVVNCTLSPESARLDDDTYKDLNNVNHNIQYIDSTYSEEYKIDLKNQEIKEQITQPFVVFYVCNK